MNSGRGCSLSYSRTAAAAAAGSHRALSNGRQLHTAQSHEDDDPETLSRQGWRCEDPDSELRVRGWQSCFGLRVERLPEKFDSD